MIMGHAARKLDVSKRYGFIDENELVNAIDKLTYDHGLTQILDLRPKNRYSGMSDVTFFVKALIHESVLQWSMFKNPNDLWCLRTDQGEGGCRSSLGPVPSLSRIRCMLHCHPSTGPTGRPTASTISM